MTRNVHVGQVWNYFVAPETDHKQLSLFDPIEISLPKGRVAFIDAVDTDLLNRPWQYSKVGYLMRSEGRKIRRYLHRVIAARMVGRELLRGELVDHVDGNKLNNSRANLRICTSSQNGMNRRRSGANTSGYKGVFWNKKDSKWEAQIKMNKVKHFLGYFDDPKEAHAAYCKAATELFGEFARFE